MTDGVERARLRTYLTGAQAETSDLAGENWRQCGKILADTAEALRKGATQIRDGEGDGQDGGLSGMMADALLAAFEDSSSSMEEKGTRLVGGGDALKDAARVMSNAKTAEAGMADLQQPPAYTAPTPLPGVPQTPQEIQAEANKRHSANQEMASYKTARAQQEAAAAQWTQKLDAVFLGSIPPMQAIHGQPDPTEPPPSVPSNPTGPSLPPTGPRTPGTPDPTDPTKPKDPDKPDDKDPEKPDKEKPEPTKPEPTKPEPTKPEPTKPEPTKPEPVDPQPPRNPITTPTHPIHQVPGETSTIGGSSQSGVTYNPSAGQAPAAPAAGGSGGGMNAAAMGAAGAAGGASGMAGGIRAGATPAPAGSAPARPIGATGRSGSAGALSRPTGAAGSSAARAGTAGSPSARGAGSAGARGAGSAGARGAGSAGARGAGSAGGRGSTSGTGSRSGGRGSTGARGAAGGANGRGGRKGEDDRAAERDSLVYEQDWLGDDDVAPGVLD